ncbi:hypothetical protein [Anaerorhabdus sp.]|uniref:hypothetical protein n=1 Tax=Anaerorhabdus sp. TaxID=1872524 RepID=UPI002FC58823
MKKSIFKGNGEWYKGNLHSHTTLSDGKLDPIQSKELYQNLGYQFISLTDHDAYFDHREELDDENFITLPGIELSAYLKTSDNSYSIKCHHMNGFLGTKEMQLNKLKNLESGTRLTPRKYLGEWKGQEVAQEMCDQLRSYGMFVMMNHPVWSRVDQDDFINTQNCWALEIFNYGTELESNTGYDTLHWDILLRRGMMMPCVATDDNHNNPRLPDSGGGYVMVQAPQLTHESIVQSLLDGNFYSSSGPTIIDFGIDEDALYITCSKVKEIRFIVGNRVGDGLTVRALPGELLEKANYKLRGHEVYGRVECVDENGCIAWSNAITIKGR